MKTLTQGLTLDGAKTVAATASGEVSHFDIPGTAVPSAATAAGVSARGQ
jgi:hypothetical protein